MHLDATELEDPGTTGILRTIRGMVNFASLLRLGGAMSVIAAMSVFLLKGWDAGNDISRYYLLLSQTFLLAMGGLGLAFLLRESKGARVFFGLGILSITANMATLGALVFSKVQWGSSLVSYPGLSVKTCGSLACINFRQQWREDKITPCINSAFLQFEMYTFKIPAVARAKAAGKIGIFHTILRLLQ